MQNFNDQKNNPCRKFPNLDYTGGGIDLISTLKDISPPRAAEPIVLPSSPTSKKPSFFKERIVTSTYIGRNIKQVRHFFLFKKKTKNTSN